MDHDIQFCSECGKGFNTQSSLDKHKYYHHELKFMCEHCGQCRGITRIHRSPSRPSHSYGRQPHSLIFMSTLYKATVLPSRHQLTSDHEPACMCHLYRPRIKTHVLNPTPCTLLSRDMVAARTKF